MMSLFPNIEAYIKNKKRLEKINLSDSIVSWLAVAVPRVARKPYRIERHPYWHHIYCDNSKRIMIMAARQTFKSTYFANRVAFVATTIPGSNGTYVAPDDTKLGTFSTQKLRRETLQNLSLRKMCSGKKTGLPGSKNHISFVNGSTIDLVTDEGGYAYVEGKSVDELLIDEAQIQELESLPVAKEALSATGGNLKIAGIGGEGGGPLETEWLETAQSEWVFDDAGWRKKLKFGPKGLIYGDYLIDVLAGKFVAKNPNSSYHGYHLTQEMFPHIPLTIKDAIELYRSSPDLSIQYKKMAYPNSIFVSHVLGGFYKASRRPITRQMVLACMEPYRQLPLFRADQVQDFKQTFPQRINVFMGVDWGSSRDGASQTAVAILLKWRGYADGRYTPNRDRYCLAWIEMRPFEHTIVQTQYMHDLFVSYGCDFGIGDLGYGEVQVDGIINGGSNPYTNKPFTGVGYDKFRGARTRTNIIEKQKDNPTEIDDQGNEKITHILLDKTGMLQNFIDFIDWRVFHPKYDDVEFSRPKLMIPYSDEMSVGFLIKDMTSILRKDLFDDITKISDDKRQNPQKQFNHPPDSVMALIYALEADKYYSANQGGEFRGTHWRSR